MIKLTCPVSNDPPSLELSNATPTSKVSPLSNESFQSQISAMNLRIDNIIKDAEATAKSSNEKFDSFSRLCSKISTHVETLQKHQESMNLKFDSLMNILSTFLQSSNPKIASALSKVSDFEVFAPTVATIPESTSPLQPAPNESMLTQE